MKAVSKLFALFALFAAIIFTVQGCAISHKPKPGPYPAPVPRSSAPSSQQSARSYGTITIVKRGEPTATPSTPSALRASANKKRVRALTESNAETPIGTDFWMWMDGGAGSMTGAKLVAYFSNERFVSGQPVVEVGPEMDSYFLESSGTYFDGSEAVPYIPTEGSGERAQARVKVLPTFYEDQSYYQGIMFVVAVEDPLTHEWIFGGTCYVAVDP